MANMITISVEDVSIDLLEYLEEYTDDELRNELERRGEKEGGDWLEYRDILDRAGQKLRAVGEVALAREIEELRFHEFREV